MALPIESAAFTKLAETALDRLRREHRAVPRITTAEDTGQDDRCDRRNTVAKASNDKVPSAQSRSFCHPASDSHHRHDPRFGYASKFMGTLMTRSLPIRK